MHYVTIHEARVPALGLGTWQLNRDACRGAVEAALAMGYRHIDTAEAYGNEAAIGAAIRESGLARSELWISSKIGPEHLRYDDLLSAARDSLKRLALDWIDLLMIHWPNPDVPLQESLKALQRLQEEKLVAHIGVSNFTPSLVREALAITPILCNQVEYHPYLDQSHLVSLAQQRDLMLTAYCPLARGRAARDPVLQKIGNAYGKTGSQVALRWLVQHPNVAAIPKASSAAHLRENLDIFDFELSADDVRRISELSRGERLIETEYSPRWEQPSV